MNSPIPATHGMNVHTVMTPSQYDATDDSNSASERRNGSDVGETVILREGRI